MAGLPLGSCNGKPLVATFSSPGGLEREAGSLGGLVSSLEDWVMLEDLERGGNGVFIAALLGNFRIGMEEPSLGLDRSWEYLRSGREEAWKGRNIKFVGYPLWSTWRGCDSVFSMPGVMSSLLGLTGDGEVAIRGSEGPVAIIGSPSPLGGMGRGRDGGSRAG